VDYATLVQHNSKIICASVTGFGRKGPHAKHRVFDTLGQARGGLIDAMQRRKDGRLLPGPGGLADQTGAIMLAYSILLALLARERFGIGQDVEISQLGGQLALQGLGINGFYFNRAMGEPPTDRSTPNPLFNTYQCKDGLHLALAAVMTDEYFAHFCKGIGHPELMEDPRFRHVMDRRANGAALTKALDGVFAARAREEWLQDLYAKDVICTPVQSYADLENDPQVIANEYLVEMEHPFKGKFKQVGVPPKLSATPGRPRKTAPQLGEHTDSVLREFGFNALEIQSLRDEKVI
jgi:formyl-CoA transferase